VHRGSAGGGRRGADERAGGGASSTSRAVATARRKAELGFRLGVRGGAVQMRRAVGAGWGGGGHDWILRGQRRGACGWMA
jgi:hypothetical protein